MAGRLPIRMSIVGACAAILNAATSCATLNEKECQTVDWRALGQEDGMNGRAASHIDRHREACAEHKLPVQDAPWHEGWAVGIRLYCTPQNGLRVGQAGSQYAGSCPADLSAGFETAYLVGKRVHDARQEFSRAQAELNDSMQRRLKATTDAEKQALDTEILLRQSAVFAAQTRQISAEAAYDRYLAGLPRG